MFKGSLRLKVDKWGSVEVAEDLGFQPNVRPVATLQRSVALHGPTFCVLLLLWGQVSTHRPEIFVDYYLL